jgi:hypothetical protein
MRQLVLDTTETQPRSSIVSEDELAPMKTRGRGGLAVIACGPESLVQETRNTVASMSLSDKIKAGGMEFHGECYAI